MRLFQKRREKKLIKLIITCKVLKQDKLLQQNYYLYCLITRVSTELEIGEVLGWTTYPFSSRTFQRSLNSQLQILTPTVQYFYCPTALL